MYFLKQKYEVFEIFKVFKALVENLSGKKIKVLRIYNRNGYVNNNLQDICEENDIQMQHSVPYTPQQNGVADHDYPIQPKWDKKTIHTAGDLAGDPLDSRKNRSQFQNALSNCDSNIPERCL